jgi:hypothetical protein
MKTIPGINIQWPWSELILKGSKKVETRGYALPQKYMGVELAIIQTPGPRGRKKGIKAKITGTVVFTGSYKYENEDHWKRDAALHLVDSEDPQFNFKKDIPKWAWQIECVKAFPRPIDPPKKRGIVFTVSCRLSS